MWDLTVKVGGTLRLQQKKESCVIPGCPASSLLTPVSVRSLLCTSLVCVVVDILFVRDRNSLCSFFALSPSPSYNLVAPTGDFIHPDSV